jgi:hypothetical protein
MRRTITVLALTALIAAPAAFAQDNSGNYTGTSTQTESQAAKGLKSEKVALKPQVGVMVYQDPATSDDTSRATYGILAEANIMSWFSRSLENVYLGPVTGALFSHLGAPDSNLFGTNSSLDMDANSNFLMIPADLKLGYTFGDDFRVAVHGGGNVIYRTVARSMNLGDRSTGTDNNWVLRPNAGADLEFGLGQHVALTLRPDLTFTSGNDIFTGTVALAFPIG